MRTYDPHRGIGRRKTQATRPLSAKKAIALYLYEILVIVVVVGTFAAVIR